MNRFLTSDERQWRLMRTVVQGVVVANADLLMGVAVLDPTRRALCVVMVMAVLSPVIAELGKAGDSDE